MAHQFIDEIKETIESNLPANASIVAKVIQAVYDQSAGAKDISDVIEHDPPTAANLLKIANSAFYGSSSQIASIQRAVVVLGFDTVKQLVTTTTVVDCFSHNGEDDGIDRMGLWYHSVGTAKACQLIAQKMRLPRPDIAYIVGLLHDIGKILLALSFPEQYKKVLDLTAEKKTRIILAERRIMNIDHTMIGQILCDMWALPDEISTAILYHHDPMVVPKGSQELAQITELGDYICRISKIGFPGDYKNVQPPASTLSLLGSSNDTMKANLQDVYRDLFKSKPELDSFFSEKAPVNDEKGA